MAVRHDTCLMTWPIARHFRVLWLFSWSIAHSFGVPRRFTSFRVMTKNSSFSCVMAVFMNYCPQFWSSKAIYKFESYDQNSSFCVLWPFSWAISHRFGFLGGFAWPARPDTCLRVMTNNFLFSHFMPAFTSYCPNLLGSKAIYMFESHYQKLAAFAFYGHFHELFPKILGFQGDLQWP